MRDIYKTAKKAQTTPVRGRVKAMMAQPRAVAQARKIARQTTGFAEGGKVQKKGKTKMWLFPGFDVPEGRLQKELTETSTKKGKPHSTFWGRARGTDRFLARMVKSKEYKEQKKQKRDRLKKRLGIKKQEKGGITDSPTKVINRLLSDEKGKPHSTTEGKEASIKRLTKRVLDRYIKKGQQQGLNPGDVRSALDLVGSSKGSFKDFLEKAKKKQAGGTVKPMSHNSELTKWFLEQHGGTQKGKPHSTRKGRIAAGERALWRGVEEFERKRKKRRMGPGAPSRPRPKAGPPAGRPKAPGGIQGLPRPKTPREYQDPRDRFKKKKKEEPGMDVKKGGVMEKGKPHSTKEGRVSSIQRRHKRALANALKNKDRLTTRDIERAEKLTKGVGKGSKRQIAIDKILKGSFDRKMILDQLLKKGKKPSKPHGEKQDPVGKKKGGKVKRGCANGGTVVMPTVGNDVRVRAYKQGALIHPRPRPTTILHGRPRGVGIAKRGW